MDPMRIIRQLMTKWKDVHYSVMIIPNAGGSVKQVRIQALCIFAALFLVVSAGLFFFVTSLVLIKSNFLMARDNSGMTQELAAQKAEIDRLSISNAQLQQDNKQLKSSSALSAEYFNRRVDEVNILKEQVDALLSLFNKQNHADIRITTSRGSPRMRMDTIIPAIAEASTLADLEKMDRVTQQIRKDIRTYSNLRRIIEREVYFRDHRPDHCPAEGTVASAFGYRADPINRRITSHQGLDINNAPGTPIHAAAAGTVKFSGMTGGYGNMIVISHGPGLETIYAHMSGRQVQEGAQVYKGQRIGAMGSTGRSTGSHLHFEVRLHDMPVDPERFLSLK